MATPFTHSTDAAPHRWFHDEVQPHTPALRAYLHRAFPHVRDVDDIVQESCLRAWRFRLAAPVQHPKSFLFQIARRLALDWLRRDHVAPFVTVPDLATLPHADPAPTGFDSAAVRDELDLLVAAFDALPPRVREVIVLRKIDGLSQKEIAARLGLSELTVQVHVVRGLRRLEDFFRSRLGDLSAR